MYDPLQGTIQRYSEYAKTASVKHTIINKQNNKMIPLHYM